MLYCNILTGGIGCGKSTIADMLLKEAYNVIFADKISNDILENLSSLIGKEFGSDVLTNGVVDRSKLGNIVFSDVAKRRALESILHPKIRDEITRLCLGLETEKKPYFVELPLYFESKYTYGCRFVVCVYANRSLQISRVMQRNNMTMQKAIKRVDSQIDIEIKREKSDFVIDNSLDLLALKSSFNKFLVDFRARF